MNYFSTFGLILDIFGVLLLFRYGLPSKVNTGDTISIESGTENRRLREKENKKIFRWAYFGLSLILCGFILQLIGSNPSWSEYLIPKR